MKRIALALMLAAIMASCQESLEDRCAREAKEYTKKKCPARIRENMIIDSMAFDRTTHTLHYYYTLNGNADNEDVIKRNDIHGALLRQIKNATSVKEYKDAGYNFAYTYCSAKEKGKVLFEVTFTQSDYR